MEIQLVDLVIASLVDALSGLIRNIFYIGLFIWGIRVLNKKIPTWEEFSKKIALWLEEYDKIKMKHYKIGDALKSRH